jgi:hypothetical protein
MFVKPQVIIIIPYGGSAGISAQRPQEASQGQGPGAHSLVKGAPEGEVPAR